MLHAIGFMGRGRGRDSDFTSTTCGLGTRVVWREYWNRHTLCGWHATHSGSCKTAAAARTRTKFISVEGPARALGAVRYRVLASLGSRERYYNLVQRAESYSSASIIDEERLLFIVDRGLSIAGTIVNR